MSGRWVTVDPAVLAAILDDRADDSPAPELEPEYGPGRRTEVITRTVTKTVRRGVHTRRVTETYRIYRTARP